MASARSSGAAQELLEPAWRMRWRVPELCLMLSDRAVAEARRTGDRSLRLRAEALALFATNRLGRGVAATARAITAVLEAEKAGEDVAAELRVELAACARSAGSHEAALRVLHPVLEQDRIEPTVRAQALLELAASLSLRRDDSECGDALDEAERTYSTVTELDRDTSRLLQARIFTARACHHRRKGDFTAGLEATVRGLELVRRLGDPAADSGEVRARLVLEQVHSLLDLGRREEALEAADSVLHQPVRAAAAGPSGWLRLALATRVHLTEGGHGTVVMMLNEAVAQAERHKLDGLLAETLSTLSYVHERGADFAQALRCLRSAYAADRRWRAAVQTARVRLLEELPALVGDVDVPSPRSRHADSVPEVAHPDPTDSSSKSGDVSVPDEQARTEPAQRFGDENVRDAARRLMETLTSREGSTSADNAKPAVQMRRSGTRPTTSAGVAGAARGPASGATESVTESVATDWTAVLPRLNRLPGEPEEPAIDADHARPDADRGDEGFPRYELSSRNTQQLVDRPSPGRLESADAPATPPLDMPQPASLPDNAEGGVADSLQSTQRFPALAGETPDSRVRGSAPWHAGDRDAPVTVMTQRAFSDVPESATRTPAEPAQQREAEPAQQQEAAEWPRESIADEDSPMAGATGRSRNGAIPDGVPAEDAEARVKSLAEIQASLQRIRERSRRPSSVVAIDTAHARHAETAASAAEAGVDGQLPTEHRELPEDPSAAVGKASDEVGLADLLAEALVAYETGRRGEEAQRRRRGETADWGTALPELGSSTGGSEAGESETGDTAAPRARHRRTTRDPDSGDPQTWTFGRP